MLRVEIYLVFMRTSEIKASSVCTGLGILSG